MEARRNERTFTALFGSELKNKMNLTPTVHKRPKRSAKQMLASSMRARMSATDDGCSGCIDEFRVLDEYCTACLRSSRSLFRNKNPNNGVTGAGGVP